MKVDSATRDAVLSITDSVLLGRWTNTYPELAAQIFCELDVGPYIDGECLLEMCDGEFRAHEEFGSQSVLTIKNLPQRDIRFAHDTSYHEPKSLVEDERGRGSRVCTATETKACDYCPHFVADQRWVKVAYQTDSLESARRHRRNGSGRKKLQRRER
jgi:hypothetical protein